MLNQVCFVENLTVNYLGDTGVWCMIFLGNIAPQHGTWGARGKRGPAESGEVYGGTATGMYLYSN